MTLSAICAEDSIPMISREERNEDLNKKDLTITNFFTRYMFAPNSSELTSRSKKKACYLSLGLVLAGGALFGVARMSMLCLGGASVQVIGRYFTPQPSQINRDSLVQEDAMLPEEIFSKYSFEYLRGVSAEKIEFPGYDSGHLLRIQEQLTKNRIPLQVCPRRPSRSYPMNKENAERYVREECSVADSVTIVKVIDSIQHISMEVFDIALTRCVKTLNRELGNQPYSIGIVCGKSNQWVASLALKDLSHLPSSWFSLGGASQGTIGLDDVPRIPQNIATIKEKCVVLFDDVSYSGSQLANNVECVLKEHPSKHVYVVVPYMTSQAYKVLIERAKMCNGSMTLISTIQKITRIMDKLTKKEFDVLNKYNIGAFGNYHYSNQKTFCYTDWRLPDGNSFIEGFGSKYTKFYETIDKRRKVLLDPAPPEKFFLPGPKGIPRPYSLEQ